MLMTLEADHGIILKELEDSDAGHIFETIDAQRLYLGRWLPFVAYTRTLSDTQAFIDSVTQAPADRFEHVFSIWYHGDFAGLVGFKATDRQNRKTEIGYWLSETFQKKGIMTRSVARLCELAFREMDMNRVQIRCAVGNHDSIGIPQRLGFKFEGIERDGELLSGGIFTDLAVYSKLRKENREHPVQVDPDNRK